MRILDVLARAAAPVGIGLVVLAQLAAVSPTNFGGATGSVPEPGTAALLAVPLLALLRRRRQSRKAN